MPSSPTIRSRAAQNPFLGKLVLLLTTAVTLAAIWTTGAAIFENIRFARATDQILSLIATTHDAAMTDKNFATQPNEDILRELIHAGLVPGDAESGQGLIANPWKGAVTAISPYPSAMRIETGMPARDCRRLALFFVKNGADLGLSLMETREDVGKIWHRFYDRTTGLSAPSKQSVEAACGEAQQTTLALVLLLR